MLGAASGTWPIETAKEGPRFGSITRHVDRMMETNLGRQWGVRWGLAV